MRAPIVRTSVFVVALALSACGGSRRDAVSTRPPEPSPAPVKPGRTQEGMASWYGPGFAGRLTANGERFDPSELTCAHRKFKFGTMLEVTNLENGRSVVVRVNDRGPYAKNRVIDLSEEAARRIGMIEKGHVKVRIEVR